MSIKCRIWWEEASQSYAFNGAYNEKFIDALKQLIPSGDRAFDFDTKTWRVKEQYGDFIRQMAINAFTINGVSFTSKQVAQQSAQARASQSKGAGAYLNPQSGGTTEDAIIAFVNLVPYDALRKAYLMAAQTLHPDKPSGDGIKMIKLNELWSRLEKELYKR